MKRFILILFTLMLLLCACTEKKEEETTTSESAKKPVIEPISITLTPGEGEKEEKIPLEDVEGLRKEPHTTDLSEIPMPEPVEPDTETADS